MIPERLMNGMNRYVDERVMPGGFLQAVICNDLFSAVGRADKESLEHLHEIVKWFYNDAPYSSIGSKEKMEKWLNG